MLPSLVTAPGSEAASSEAALVPAARPHPDSLAALLAPLGPLDRLLGACRRGEALAPADADRDTFTALLHALRQVGTVARATLGNPDKALVLGLGPHLGEPALHLSAQRRGLAPVLPIRPILTPLQTQADSHPMSNSNLIRVEFEGRPLVAYLFRGRYVWIAADAGCHLGYGANGRKLVDTMTQNWSDELIKGVDFDVLEGADLAEFKANLGDAHETWASKLNRSVTVLYESGLDMVCIKTEKPLGKKLRRLLVKEVMPKLRRNEPILPSAEAIQMLLGRFASLEAAVTKSGEATAALQADVIDIRARLASNGRRTDGLIGAHDAKFYILGPLKSLAHQLASARGVSFRSLYNEMDQAVRRAADHHRAEKGNRWERLPQDKLGHAHLVVLSLQDRHRAELQAHAERMARDGQLTLRTG